MNYIEKLNQVLNDNDLILDMIIPGVNFENVSTEEKAKELLESLQRMNIV